MKNWSNIERLRWDPEIREIDRFEKSLGEIPKIVKNIRELITRFEVCHFKYSEHIRTITFSLHNLVKMVEPSTIGKNHISKGLKVLKNDKTGRSKIGQQYVRAIRKWLKNDTSKKEAIRKTKEFDENISKWLGAKNPDKIRLIKLLLARILWDWESYNKLQIKGEYEELEKQICRIDICHYAFPSNLDLLLKSIGEMKLADGFEGCGSFNEKIKEEVIREIKYINKHLIKWSKEKRVPTQARLYKIWLLTSLKKTLIEQLHLYSPKIESAN
ncbi:MAG: hypothetical protein EPN82_07240 [Bacteroidetes bacterium]|nr:MAG: hypothetical protein EPN82_07240 [Bacteroidota bacterium]